MRTRLGWPLLVVLLAMPGFAQDSDNSRLTTCTLTDQKEISARFVPGSSKAKLPEGRAWAPGGSPIVLFSQSAMTVGGTALPVGAYTAYILPAKAGWTFIVSKDVNEKTYDAGQDLVRVAMKSGSLSQAADPFTITFAHDAPRQCSLQVYYGKNGYWVDFQEK